MRAAAKRKDRPRDVSAKNKDNVKIEDLTHWVPGSLKKGLLALQKNYL